MDFDEELQRMTNLSKYDSGEMTTDEEREYIIGIIQKFPSIITDDVLPLLSQKDREEFLNKLDEID